MTCTEKELADVLEQLQQTNNDPNMVMVTSFHWPLDLGEECIVRWKPSPYSKSKKDTIYQKIGAGITSDIKEAKVFPSREDASVHMLRFDGIGYSAPEIINISEL